MRRLSYRPFVFIFFSLTLILCLPLRFTEGMRTRLVRLLHISWEGLTVASKNSDGESERLKLENQSLRAQIQKIREWLLFEDRIDDQLTRYKEIADNSESDAYWKAFFLKRGEHLLQFVNKQFQALPAQVVYRDPTTWSSCLWVNVGENDNEALGRKIIEKNSPVLAGSFVVGIVDVVGPAQSRVRLITDESLAPAVRAARGGEYNRLLKDHLDALALGLEVKDNLEKKEEYLQVLHEIGQHLDEKKGSYLAKGELHGGSQPLWRARSQLLKGVGFNFDYADEEGPARDLRSTDAILKVGDLLVTSGLDGVFPPDLPIATVEKIGQLREGACSYEILARPLYSNMNDLTTLFVFPALLKNSK